jgi:NAD(P)-dependent dehydrogenase (short-subunit alcohol dehydrogenase family)
MPPDTDTDTDTGTGTGTDTGTGTSTDTGVAIVTGASSGIGRGIARRLAADGFDVVVGDVRRAPKQGEHFETDVTTPTDRLVVDEHGVDARYVETDTGDPGDVEALVAETVEAFGRLDVLVNNAGILIPGGSQAVSREDWQRVVDVNQTGYFLAAKHAIPHLVESSRGRIVNVSSVNARFGGAGPAYASTKAAVVNLTRDLAVEVADEGVTVNAVLPGVVGTPLQDLNDEETIERQAENTPLPRIGTPEDVANAVAFLVSEEAEWITGTDLVVDGGYLAGGY